MKTSQILLTILTGMHGSVAASPQVKCPWDDIIATYLAAAIPVALWLETVEQPVKLSQFVYRSAVTELLEKPHPAAGSLFPAICAPLRLALDQFPEDSIEFAGLNPLDTIPGLGFLCLRATELTIETEQKLDALAQPKAQPTNLTEFSTVPLNGWFKSEIKGAWQRKTSATTGAITLNGTTHETPLFDHDPVFVQ
jgi:hypothetical protein